MKISIVGEKLFNRIYIISSAKSSTVSEPNHMHHNKTSEAQESSHSWEYEIETVASKEHKNSLDNASSMTDEY